MTSYKCFVACFVDGVLTPNTENSNFPYQVPNFHKCEICLLSFPRETQFQRHMRDHEQNDKVWIMLDITSVHWYFHVLSSEANTRHLFYFFSVPPLIIITWGPQSFVTYHFHVFSCFLWDTIFLWCLLIRLLFPDQ